MQQIKQLTINIHSTDPCGGGGDKTKYKRKSKKVQGGRCKCMTGVNYSATGNALGGTCI